MITYNVGSRNLFFDFLTYLYDQLTDLWLPPEEAESVGGVLRPAAAAARRMLLGHNSIEQFWLKFWLEKPLFGLKSKFWLEKTKFWLEKTKFGLEKKTHFGL